MEAKLKEFRVNQKKIQSNKSFLFSFLNIWKTNFPKDDAPDGFQVNNFNILLYFINYT